MRILLVEDEPVLAQAMRSALIGDGHAVDRVADGGDALDYATTYPYDLVLLDVILPGLSGLEVCDRLHAMPSRPRVLMVTALDAVDERVAGLDRGADDYLPKPFAMTELLARVRALHRREVAVGPVLRVGDLDVDPTRRQVWRDGVEIRLTAREFALLEVLAREPGRVFSQDRLIDAVWDAAFDASSNVVEVYIRSLRRKVDAGRRNGIIQTVRGVGYRLVEAPEQTS
jgi:two-component system OmpR family response regulator